MTTTRFSSSKKWLLLVIALVLVSAVRYRFTMTHISSDPANVATKNPKRYPTQQTAASSGGKPERHSDTLDSDDHAPVEKQKSHKTSNKNQHESSKQHNKPGSNATKSKKDTKSVQAMNTTNSTVSKKETKEAKSKRIQETEKESKSKDTANTIESKNARSAADSKKDTKSKNETAATTESLVHNNNTVAEPSRLVPPYNKEKADQFTNTSCLLQNTEWFPSTASQEWQLRAPRFMILGARDSGTRMLVSRLLQHSQILSNSHYSTQELAYFSQPTFVLLPPTKPIHVSKVRQRMYARDYPWKLLHANKSLITMDATPDYLFYSHVLPRSILCSCPWIQMLVILRNPVDCVHASFRRATSTLGWKGTLEEYVRVDMETMERAGLIGSTKKQDTDEAWRLYLSYTKDGPVGRGFYEVQLQQWFSVIRQMGRDPLQAVRVIRYEEYKAHPKKVYEDVLRFLGLPMEDTLTTTSAITNSNSSLSSLMGVNKEDELTMTRLRKFFRPYNKRLYKLLGDDWDGCWDDDKR